MSNNIYFTPGPAQLYHTFEEHLKRALFQDIPSISHRSTTFIQIMKETTVALKELLELPEGYDIYFLNSANEAWDRIIQNLVETRSHHFANGSFSKKFHDFALANGKASTVTQVADGASYSDWSIPEEAELIGLTKNETSVGHMTREDEVQALREKHPDKLIALDVVSATPSMVIDYSKVDTAYFSVQKGFGLPAGLGVWIVNQKCQEVAQRRATSTSLGSYRTLPNLKKFGDKSQTPETPNMLFIYLLGKVAQDLLMAGVKRLRNDTIYKATLLNQVIESHPLLSHFVSSKPHRSSATLVAKTAHGDRFISQLAAKRLILGKGYGPHKEDHIRIANFPTHSKESIEMLCDLLNQVE